MEGRNDVGKLNLLILGKIGRGTGGGNNMGEKKIVFSNNLEKRIPLILVRAPNFCGLSDIDDLQWADMLVFYLARMSCYQEELID